MNLAEYFTVLTCRRLLTNLCALVTLMQLCFPPHLHFLLSHMQCWHVCVIEQKWFLTDKTNLPTHPLQFNLSIFNSVRWPDWGSKDLWNIAVTMHSPFPLFPTIVTDWRKRVTTIQIITWWIFFFFSIMTWSFKKKKSSKALVLKL